MTKLNLTLDAHTLNVVYCDDVTSNVLHCHPSCTTSSGNTCGVNNQDKKNDPDGTIKVTDESIHTTPTTCTRPTTMEEILADENEMQTFKNGLQRLLVAYDQDGGDTCSFETMNLVFQAPGVEEEGLNANRTPLNNIAFRSPMTAIHTCGITEIATFAHVQLKVVSNKNEVKTTTTPGNGHSDTLSTSGVATTGDEDGSNHSRNTVPSKKLLVEITALEYSRKHRERYLQQEFGSWLVEDHIEKAVIATTLTGQVCFWNRFATELYQYTQDEVMGRNIMELTPAEMSQEQGMEIMSQLMQGQHWKGMFRVQRKDKSTFMAHVTDTPVLGGVDNSVQFIVGVSADYTKVHDLMDQLQDLNTNLEQQVIDRTAQLVQQERFLRLVGAAVKASDTGILITNEQHQIIWSNDAASKLLLLRSSMCPTQEEEKEENDDDEIADILHGHCPWELDCIKDETELHDFLKRTMKHPNVVTEEGDDGSGMGSDTPASVELQLDVRGRLPIDYLSVHVQVLENPAGSGSTDANGQQQHMITLRDETSQRQAEESQRQAEIAHHSSKTKTEMMQMLSHELRSPLQGIMGVSSTMLEDIPSSSPDQNNTTNEIHDNISTILASSRLLLTLINNVLDLRKLDANMMQEIQLGPVSVLDCMDNARLFCNPFATQQNVKLRVSVPSTTLATDVTTTASTRSDPPSLPQPQQQLPYVMANRLRVEQVLINLITNGVKYTRPGSELVLSVRTASAREAFQDALQAPSSDLKMMDPQELATVVRTTSLENKHNEGDDARAADNAVMVFSVRDHGRGIPANEYDKVFGEFTQLKLSHQKDNAYGGTKQSNPSMAAQSSGTGLGLNLVLKFVTAMKGHVWFRNCDGASDGDGTAGGAEFSFCLPMVAAPTTSDVLTTSSTSGTGKCRTLESRNSLPRPIANLRSTDLRVLVVDDSLINLKVITKMLKRLGVENVETSTRGGKALDYVRSRMALISDKAEMDDSQRSPSSPSRTMIPNLIISDLNMPEMDGYELIQEIRQLELPQQPHAMAWTADCSTEVELDAIQAGFDGIIRKPVTIREVEEVLTQLVIREENPQS